MKPKRMHMVHNMVVNYGLYKKLDIVVRLSFWIRTIDKKSVYFNRYLCNLRNQHDVQLFKWPVFILMSMSTFYKLWHQTTWNHWLYNMEVSNKELHDVRLHLELLFQLWLTSFLLNSQCWWRLSCIWRTVWILLYISRRING